MQYANLTIYVYITLDKYCELCKDLFCIFTKFHFLANEKIDEQIKIHFVISSSRSRRLNPQLCYINGLDTFFHRSLMVYRAWRRYMYANNMNIYIWELQSFTHTIIVLCGRVTANRDREVTLGWGVCFLLSHSRKHVVHQITCTCVEGGTYPFRTSHHP